MTLEDASEAWVIMAPQIVPTQWAGRARQVALVPLLPTEAEQIFGGRPSIPETTAEEQQLLGLVAQGTPVARMARVLGVSTSTIHRRLARLRALFGVSTNVQLAVAVGRVGLDR